MAVARRRSRSKGRVSKWEALEERRFLTVTAGTAPSNITGVANETAVVKLSQTFSTDQSGGTVVELDTVVGSSSDPANHAPVDILVYGSAGGGAASLFLKNVRAGAYDNTFFDDAQNFNGNSGSTAGQDVPNQPAAYLQAGKYAIDPASGLVASVASTGTTSLKYNTSFPNLKGAVAMVPDDGSTRSSGAFRINTTDNTSHFTNTSGYQVFGEIYSGLATIAGSGTISQPSKGGNSTGTASGGYASLSRESLTFTASLAPPTTLALGHVPVASAAGGTNPENLVRIVSASEVGTTSLLYTVTAGDSRIVTGYTVDVKGNLTLDLGTTTGTTTVSVVAKDLSGATNTTTFSVTIPTAGIDARVARQPVNKGKPSAATFGSVFVGQELSTALTIRNTGQGNLVLGQISIPTGFTLTSGTNVMTGTADLATTLRPGRTASYELTVDTSRAGGYSGNFQIANNASTGGVLSFPFSASVGNGVVVGAGFPTAVTFADADGTVGTLTVKGSGRATVTFTGSSLSAATKGSTTTVSGEGVSAASIAITGTDAKSTVTLKGKKGDGVVSVGGISATTSAKTLDFGAAAVTGTGTFVGSFGTVTFGSLAGATESFGATSGGKVTATGSVRSLVVKGAVTGSTVAATGGLNSVRAASITSSAVWMAVTKIGDDGTPSFGSLTSSYLGGLTVTSKAADAFSGSQIFAGTIGTLNLGKITTAGEASMLDAATVGTLSGIGPDGKKFAVKRIKAGVDVTGALAAAGIPASRLSFAFATVDSGSAGNAG